MKALVCAVLVGLLCLPHSTAKESPPKVQVYSRGPGHFDKDNTLICHVSGFHPPEITIELLKNEQELPGAKQTDLAFEENWHYHLTKHAPFTPRQADKFACRVTHMGRTTTYSWESDM
ncbi:beta-2-microglobulin-like [Sander lucioperca]|uniref:Beta-2-microglobulin n=1 Tax=Sander lucioperca TaxID=283035 RepID=A0A8C9ZI66_SANLU|nr:beta-2-microglobulin-like [Sander lucioperca]XP_035852291.1 beta-2-microglobulin-like [Sander lucioperca]